MYEIDNFIYVKQMIYRFQGEQNLINWVRIIIERQKYV